MCLVVTELVKLGERILRKWLGERLSEMEHFFIIKLIYIIIHK